MKTISESTILGRTNGPRGRAREEENEDGKETLQKETLHNEVHDMYFSCNSVSDYTKVIFDKILSGRQPSEGVTILQCLRVAGP
jgi:hypothetical protein